MYNEQIRICGGHVMQKKNIIFIMCIFALLFVTLEYIEAQTPMEILNQYVTDLKKNPNDNALREKIIKHVRSMKQSPAMPEEAKKYMVRGREAFKSAKEAKDFNDAIDEFKKAVLCAPWLAEGYYNLGIIQDKAGLYTDAMQNLKLYLMAAPNSRDAEEVKELIYEIEYRQEKTAKESSPEAIAEKSQKDFNKWLKSLDGTRYSCVVAPRYLDCTEKIEIDIRGNEAVFGQTMIKFFNKEMAKLNSGNIGRFREWGRVVIREREFTIFADEKKSIFWKFQISKDDQTISIIRTSEPYMRYEKGTMLQRER